MSSLASLRMPLRLSPRLSLRLPLIAALLSAGTLVGADEGHDHGPGQGHADAALAGRALPRFGTASPTFELVGVLDGERLVLYLDRVADNSPVLDARITLEVAGVRHAAEPLDGPPDGDAYEVALGAALPAGVSPVVVTASADGTTERLEAELDLHADASDGPAAHDAAAPHADDGAASSWRGVAAWAAGAVGVIAMIAAIGLLVAAARRVSAARAARAGGAA